MLGAAFINAVRAFVRASCLARVESIEGADAIAPSVAVLDCGHRVLFRGAMRKGSRVVCEECVRMVEVSAEQRG